MMSKSVVFSVLLFSLWTAVMCKCPGECRCDNKENKKRVTCDRGGMTEIPTIYMDTETQILVITAPPHNPNDLTIGRIFMDFHQLEEVRITYSKLPAIGDSSFWPGKKLRLLDLSHNNVSFLRDSDFNGLTNLKILDLSYNNIAATPSAPFRLLSSLTTLLLGTNRLQTLVPRFFYMLPKLEKLDLSGNPLKDIDPENLKDVKPLKRLHLASCNLTRLHSLIYQLLPNLEELDLRDNNFKIFSPEEFRHLRKLKYLHLDGNNLTVMVEKTFDGHNLRHLGLSRNQIYSFSICSFCNLSVQQLDLSSNNIHTLTGDVLSPISHSLESLDISRNQLEPEMIANLVSPLFKLKKLSLSGLKLNDLPDDTFVATSDLKTLDLSHNNFFNLSQGLLHPLKNLEELDLSHNHFEHIEAAVLDTLRNMTSLYNVHLHANPWSCYKCKILPLLAWIAMSKMYKGLCDQNTDNPKCLVCMSPERLENKILQTLRPSELEPCLISTSQSRVLIANSNVGIIVAIAIIVLLLMVIIITIIMYRQQGAVYYTHEEERCSDFYRSSPVLDTNGGYHEPKRTAFFVTLDRIDEIIEDKTLDRTNIG